jgi:hypothetical protein
MVDQISVMVAAVVTSVGVLMLVRADWRPRGPPRVGQVLALCFW